MENGDAMPPQMIYLIVGFFTVVVIIAITVTIVSTRAHRPFREEEARAKDLAVRGHHIMGRVIAWKKLPGGSESTQGVLIKASFILNNVEHETELPIHVDRGLLNRIAPGSHLHLLVDPDDPAQVAVDRARSPVEVPDGW